MPKSYVFTAFGDRKNEKFLDMPRPSPGEGQLLVKVRAAGVNPRDWKERAGQYGTSQVLSTPRQMGSEISGTIEELGTGIRGFCVGDAIFASAIGNGAFSEYSLVLASEAAQKPNGVSFLDAATLPVAGATAYAGVRQLALSRGETILIIGIGGGVGIAAAQIAIADGARVVGTASATKKSLVESIGAVHVEYGVGCVDRVQALTPNGIDAAFDTVGGDAMLEFGTLLGSGSRVIAAARPTAAAAFGGTRVGRRRDASVLDALAKMVVAGTFRPVVTAVFPLDRVGDALALVEAGHATGKVAIEII